MDIGSIWKGWKIVSLLGDGSFGKVYRIEREEFGHVYSSALKVIRIPQSQSEYDNMLNQGMDERSAAHYYRSMVEGLVNEFTLMSTLRGHSNIVSYEDHEVMEIPGEFGWEICIRMELLKPLFTYLREHDFTYRDVIQLGIDMCSALEICERYEIIHRDIKPENIFYSDFGTFKLGDFGVAKRMESASAGLSKKGTYSYMAPEVYKGDPGADHTADIYSLGIVLYRFLNDNRSPFLPPYPEPIHFNDAERANALRIQGTPLPPPSKDKGRLCEIVLKACEYDPKKRYRTATAMKKDLEALAASDDRPDFTLNQEEEEWGKPLLSLQSQTEVIPIKKLPATVGRNSQSVDVLLKHYSVSRVHCRFDIYQGRVVVEDLNSTIGTKIGQTQLERGRKYYVESDQKITIGDMRFTISVNYDEVAKFEARRTQNTERSATEINWPKRERTAEPQLPTQSIQQPSRRFCRHCGAEMFGMEVFCRKCGKRV